MIFGPLQLRKYQEIFLRDVTAFGGALFYGLIALFLIILKEYSLVIRIMGGFALILIITSLIRIVYFKDRPVKEEYHNWMERIDASSFPSMHTARAFFFSLTLIAFFQYKLWISIFLIALAILVSYSRIFLKKHDWWDLLGGGVLGAITFWLSTLIL